jgi:bifunctional DNA-binding transcriptional regulator/antitoxin component of YhaV-PrlF toxin-antitoxin module
MKGTAQVRREGCITLPKSVRRELDLDYGDFVVIDVCPVEEVNDG